MQDNDNDGNLGVEDETEGHAISSGRASRWGVADDAAPDGGDSEGHAFSRGFAADEPSAGDADDTQGHTGNHRF
jgi:hypothetical protein